MGGLGPGSGGFEILVIGLVALLVVGAIPKLRRPARAGDAPGEDVSGHDT